MYLVNNFLCTHVARWSCLSTMCFWGAFKSWIKIVCSMSTSLSSKSRITYGDISLLNSVEVALLNTARWAKYYRSTYVPLLEPSHLGVLDRMPPWYRYGKWMEYTKSLLSGENVSIWGGNALVLSGSKIKKSINYGVWFSGDFDMKHLKQIYSLGAKCTRQRAWSIVWTVSVIVTTMTHLLGC